MKHLLSGTQDRATGSWSGSATRASFAGRRHLLWGRQGTEGLKSLSLQMAVPCNPPAPSRIPSQAFHPSTLPHCQSQSLLTALATQASQPTLQASVWGKGDGRGEPPAWRRRPNSRGLRGPGEHTAESHALRRERAGVALRRQSGNTSSQWRWYSSIVFPTLPGAERWAGPALRLRTGLRGDTALVFVAGGPYVAAFVAQRRYFLEYHQSSKRSGVSPASSDFSGNKGWVVKSWELCQCGSPDVSWCQLL